MLSGLESPLAAVSPELVDLLKALFADKHGELAQALQREAWAADWALKLDPHERTSPEVWLHQLALRARLEGCEAELLALLRRLRSKRVAEIDAVAGVLRPAEPPAAPAPPMGGATLHPGGTADHRAALAQSAPPEDAPAPPSGPTLILHLTRAARGDRRVVALPTAPIEYHRHLPDGRVRVFTLDWPALIPHVTGLATARSADAVLGLGRALREALLPSGWDELEDALAETLRHGPALLLIQVNADELHALPWEVMPLGGDGPPLAEARGLTILHHQPGVRPPPSPRGAPKAILLAWAGARGRVPAGAVEAALGEGVTSLAAHRAARRSALARAPRRPGAARPRRAPGRHHRPRLGR
jgi:hypothetical protein